MTGIRVAVADDHPVVLAGIKALLQAAPEITLVGDATTGKAAIELIRQAAPDIAVIDISLPISAGWTSPAASRRRVPRSSSWH